MTQTFQGTFTKIIDDSQVLCHKTQSLEAATRNAYDETRNLHDTVRTAMESSETKQGDIVRMLNQLLELSLKHDTGSRVVEEVDDSGQLLNKAANQSIQADEELSECIDAIVRSIQDKEGVFGVHEVEEVADAMIVLLKIISSEQSRYFTSDCSSGSTTERELKDLRRNLMAVQGMVMCSRTISLNKTGESPISRGLPEKLV
jgi:predicted DNA-binding ArsR family transcriptional regulator